MSDIITELEELNIGKIEKNVSLKKYTTYRVGGIAKCIIFPKNVKALVKLIKYLKTKKVKYKVLGNGSNVLFSDKDYEGVLIKLNDIDDIEFFGKNKIRVGAGVNLIKLSVLTAKHGLTGLEFAAGIPGTVGGSVFMNAGAYKSDMGYVVERVKVLTPDESIIKN